MYDIVVIGGGVIGGTILREITKYNLKAVLLEKESDVSMGQSRANSGIVHAGFDAIENSNKAKFNVLGNQMMQDYCNELGVKYKNNGSLVLAYNEEDEKTLQQLLIRGNNNGVKDLSIISKEQLLQLEPNISKNAISALYAKTGGIVCPYELTIASIGNAIDNGATLMTDFEVVNISKEENVFTITSSKGEVVKGKIIVNASGSGCQKIANLVGDNSFKVGFRRGEYILLDRESGDFVNHTIFTAPTKKGKGILITQTVDGNILLGPTAQEIEENDVSTTSNGLNEIISKVKNMVENVPLYNTITSFSGVRVYCDKSDFIISESNGCKNFINVAGIESPGLTSAPAISKYVVEEIISKLIKLEKNEKFNGIRRSDYFFSRLSIEEKNKIIKQDSRYGNVVCRCEKITEGEIVRAIHENPKATTVDAIKRRTRSGMGRCQGGFCGPRVMEILARELNVPLSDITKSGGKSNIVIGRTK